MTKLTPKQKLLNLFRGAMSQYVVISCVIPGQPTCEVQINRRESFEAKAEYIDKQYDDDLQHKFAPDVKIVDWYVTTDLRTFDLDSMFD